MQIDFSGGACYYSNIIRNGKQGKIKMAEYGRKIGRAAAPLLIYLGISYGVLIMMGISGAYPQTSGLAGIDAALATTLTAVFSFPVLWWMWRRDQQQYLYDQGKQRGKCWIFPAAFFSGMLASCAGSFLMQISGITEFFSNRVQEELFSGDILVQILGLGIAVPVVEELLYRGLVYHRLLEFLPKKGALAVAILLFALSHGNMIQIIYALPMACLLHWFYEKAGFLKVPILFHMGANLISVVLQFYL